jgi:hypothetical protein
MAPRILTQAPPAAPRDVLPDDDYIMTVDEVKIEQDQYAKPEKDGEQPWVLVVTWHLLDEDVTRKQRRKDIKGGRKLWQRFGLFVYVKPDGTPTKLKAFLDAIDGSVNREGIALDYAQHIESGDLDALCDDLVGIKARCFVETYVKSKGARAGEKDNRIIKVLPLDDEDDEPAPPVKPAAPAPKQRPTLKNAPQPVDDDPLFDDEPPY